MASIETKISFLQKHWINPKGRPFSIEGREWVQDFFRSLEGFKCWPVDQKHLCLICHSQWGSVIEDEQETKHTRTEQHRQENQGCLGLDSEPIFFIVFKADRRTGKTFNFGGYCGASMYLETWQNIAFVSTSFMSSEDLIQENFKGPIEANKALNQRTRITKRLITIQKQRSKLRFFGTVPKAMTGKGFTLIGIDEARDVDAKVAIAVLPSIQESNGIKCVHCAYFKMGIPSQTVDRCPNCGFNLKHWYGRAAIMSSAGLIKERSGQDWFFHLRNRLISNPDKSAHLIEIDNAALANPEFSQDSKNAAKRIFSSVQGLKELVDVEYSSEFRKEGEQFINDTDIDAAVDFLLENKTPILEPTIFFLDTSKIQHLTSLVGLSSIPEGRKHFEKSYVSHITYWDPRERNPDKSLILPYGIEPRLIEEVCDEIMPQTPNLIGLWIDCRNAKGVTWAKPFVKKLKEEKKYGHLVHIVNEDYGKNFRDAGWAEVERSIMHRLIKIPNNPRLLQELRGAVWKMYRGNIRVHESTASNHLDVAEGLAATAVLSLMHGNKKRGFTENSKAVDSKLKEINEKIKAKFSGMF